MENIENLFVEKNKIIDNDSYKDVLEENERLKKIIVSQNELINAYRKQQLLCNEKIPKSRKLNDESKIIHTGDVNCLLELKNGSLLSGSNDKTIILWVFDGKYNAKKSIVGHKLSVRTLSEINSKYVASGSDDNTIRVWDQTREYLCSFIIRDHFNTVRRLLSTSNGLLVSASYDQSLKVFNPLDNFRMVYSLSGHKNWVIAVIELENNVLISGSSDRTIKAWDFSISTSNISSIEAHEDFILDLTKIGKNKFATSSRDNKIKIWTFDNIKKEFIFDLSLENHSGAVFSIIYFTTGYLVSGSEDKTIKIFDLNEKNDKCIQTIKNENTVLVVAEVNKGKILSGFNNGEVRIFASNTNYVETDF